MPAPPRIQLTPENHAEAAEAAARVLRNGGVALLPAEGVYGIHALAADERAVARVRALKPRGAAKAYIGLLRSADEVRRWVPSLDPAAEALIRAHWPGALTVVLPAGALVPPSLRAEDGTVALRCPGSAFLREVVGQSGGLVLSTSANAPGEPPATRAGGALEGRVDLIVDQGALDGTPSTIVRIEKGRVALVRAGAVRIAEPSPGEGPLDAG